MKSAAYSLLRAAALCGSVLLGAAGSDAFAQISAATPAPGTGAPAQAPAVAPTPAPPAPAVPTPGLIPGAQGLAGPAIQPVTGVLPVAPPASATAEIDQDYKVNAGDVLEVQVVGLDQAPRKVRVDATGLITLPLIGGVKVAGKPTRDIETQVADALREKYMQDPQVTVFVEESVSQRFSIQGAVRQPNLFPLKGRTTLMQALAMGGGATKVADLTQVRVLRGHGAQMQNLVFDAEKIQDGTLQDPQIFGNDVIIVEASTAKTAFYETLDTIRGLVSFGTVR
ncbi:MAG: polysaccharide export protein [Proteobacteria bacterium]|nr:polysaccharide export protein [Pseudomonadota bacterium]